MGDGSSVGATSTIPRTPNPDRLAAIGSGAQAIGHTDRVDVVADVDLSCRDQDLFVWVDDLSRYPRWLDIVARAEPEPFDVGGPDRAGAEGDDRDRFGEAKAWAVDLRGRLGPLARSKRLRMVRTELVAPRRAVFERVELDGRQHSPWRLAVDVTATSGGSHLRMHLHYGGSLLGPVVERLLRDEIERSKSRLGELVATD